MPSARGSSGPHLPRRRWLQTGALGLFGLSSSLLTTAKRVARAAPAPASPTVGTFGRAKSCILLFMWGGPAHQDTWDLKPDAPAEIRGPFRPIETRVPGIRICEHFPLLAQRTDKLAVLRAMTHGNVDHTPSTHFLLTGQPPPPGPDKRTETPHVGAVLARLGRGRSVLPPFVSMRPKLENTVPRFVEESRGQFAGWLGPAWDPLTIDADPARPDYKVGDFVPLPHLDARRLRERQSLWQSLDRVAAAGPQRRGLAESNSARAMQGHQARAFELLDSTVGPEAFDLAREPDAVRDRYGRHPHGQSVLQARRLVERGVPLVTVFWPNDGVKNVSVYWDTHSKNFVDLEQRLMPPADRAFSALLDDLGDRGMLDETLVVWTGEFGRTPRIGQRNSDAGAGADGRDHWPNCFTSVVAGGGLRTGLVHGASDRHAAYPASEATPPRDLVATIYHALGVPPDLVLHDAQGRPIPIVPGEPIRALL